MPIADSVQLTAARNDSALSYDVGFTASAVASLDDACTGVEGQTGPCACGGQPPSTLPIGLDGAAYVSLDLPLYLSSFCPFFIGFYLSSCLRHFLVSPSCNTTPCDGFRWKVYARIRPRVIK